MRVFMLMRENRKHYYLFGQVLERIEAFCRENDSDADPKDLSQRVEQDYVREDPCFCLLVAEADGKVAGHLLASLDTWMGRKFLTVVQMAIDKHSGVPLSELRAGLDMLTSWGELNMAVGIQALVPPGGAHSRRLRRFYGMVEHKVLLRKEF